MKAIRTLSIVVSLFLLLLVAHGAGKRDALWKGVEAAAEEGLPKTAIEKLDAIIGAAMKDKAYPEAIKAIARKIEFEAEVAGGRAEEKITRLEAEIAKAPKEMVPVMEAILADWYWQYFRGNRGRFLPRTAVAIPGIPGLEAPGGGARDAGAQNGAAASNPKDITTWDLPRIFAEIDRQFTKALSAEAELKKIAVADFDALLEKGTVPDSYRPTLYDFLAHETLAFYTSGEQAAAKSEDAFDITAESPIFGAAEEFLKWEPATTDKDSVTLKAVRLYQNLLRFHADDADKSALLHCDLQRLGFGKNVVSGEEKGARYTAVLKRFAEQWADHELSAWARFEWANVLHDENEFAEAHTIAKQGAGAFPKSLGGKLCRSLVTTIESKSVSIETERVWNSPPTVIAVRYRNLTGLHFRLVRLDFAQTVRQSADDDDYPKRLLGMKPERAWKVALPATRDFRERTEEIAAPQDLKPGFYALIASPKADFGEKDNVVSVADVWVSDLALVLREDDGDSKIAGFVLDARSGEPIQGAEVRLWTEGKRGFSPAWTTTKTDRNGQFSKSGKRGTETMVEVKFKGQQLVSGDPFSLGEKQKERDVESQTVFFTDRSLYRPGQTIHYKGICIRADREKDKYAVLAKQSVTVIFGDVNGTEIAKATHRTNDYGSFSGSFTAPRERLTGTMMLSVKGEPHGTAAFNVEEYKRPKFSVALDAPKDAAKLSAKVSVAGRATAYTGATIGGAKVSWRVERFLQLPSWWSAAFWWRRMPFGFDPQEIAHGTTVTKDDGSFAVEFVAKPDSALSEKDEPVFSFNVHADVTDTTGETRSSQRGVNVGYTALKASLAADEWLTAKKPVELSVLTQSLDNEPRAAEGVIKIYKLRQPAQVVRAKLGGEENFGRRGPLVADKPPKLDPANPDSWELGAVAVERAFKTGGDGKAALNFQLGAGPYRAMLETKDQFGNAVRAQLQFNVLNLDGKPLAVRIPNLVAAPKWEAEPGEEFTALWGTGYDSARAFIEIEHRRTMVQAFWTEPGLSQQQVKQAVTEAMRGGFTLHVTMVRENRAYLTSQEIGVPWSNKELKVKWEHFTSKLEPAAKETWTAVITGPDAKKATAEMVAALYDQSLDAYLPHHWQRAFTVFRQDEPRTEMKFENGVKGFEGLVGNWDPSHEPPEIKYRQFPGEIEAAAAGVGGGMPKAMMMRAYDGMSRGPDMRRPEPPSVSMEGGAPLSAGNRSGRTAISANAIDALLSGTGGAGLAPGIHSLVGAATDPTFQLVMRGLNQKKGVDSLSTVSTRKNLNETAFFFPHLLTRADGSVAMEFTMPEALTTWRFIGFAHDRDLRGGYLEDKAVTAKDIMVQPNPPRFLREGDALDFTVRVSNQSATQQGGKVRLAFADARTGKPALADAAGDQDFDLPSHESRSFSWKLTVPDGAEPLSYKAVASTDRLSDGEEGLLPVLSRRTLVTESLPLPIRGAQKKNFDFKKLIESGKSDTLKSQSLTVQMVSNPSWYAVMALPYLMEFPHECTEQTFSRLYANALARHIAASDPKIRRVFDQWKATPSTDSPLEKNQDIKSVMLEETPWVRQAQAESVSRKNVGVLFDDNRLNDETARLLRKLGEQQLDDGMWPWFPGGRGNEFITLHITTGFGRLRHLGVKIDTIAAVKSLARLDAWIEKTYRDIKPKDREADHLSSTIALYLYGRSFFLGEKPVEAKHREAVDYFLGQARKHWLKMERQSQGHLAIALKRFGTKENLTSAAGIARSIKEHSTENEETGMFWRDEERSWWWYRAPIETQALMIEMFDEVVNDVKAVEDCKVWLLKQKQTQDWKTTKATVDAIYALLLRGDKVLASDELVELTLGGKAIRPERVEAGTGFCEEKFVRGEIKPEQGHITLKKTDKGVAWGSVHWQYLEDMSKVTADKGTPLKLTKTLFTKQNTKNGPVLEPVKGPVKVGDEVVVRIVLSTDRDMEYLHLKDHRGSGTEPVNVLSGYKFQDGLAYYESTKDTASHFFIDYLPKGNYVFEYSTRIVHKGRYQTGFAGIECMYAPEFKSHSESIWVVAE